MPARKKIPYKTSVMVQHVAPTNEGVDPHEPLSFTDDGSTCSFRVYDHAKEGAISEDEVSGEVVLFVTGAASFEVEDAVEVEQDDGSVHSSSLVSVIPEAGTVELSTPLTAAASAGRRVRCRLGSPVTMFEYGTPKLGEEDWGFEGLLASNHPGLEIGVEVDIEITFIGDPANPGDLDQLEVICGVVRPQVDCSEY